MGLVGCVRTVAYRLPVFIPPVDAWGEAPDARAYELLESAWSDLQAGRVLDARERVIQIQGQYPEWAAPWVVEGFSYYLERRWTRALQAFGRALQIRENQVGALYGMMLTYEASGEPETALQYGEILADRFPQDPDLARHIQALELHALQRMVERAREAAARDDIREADYWYKQAIARMPQDTNLLMEFADWLDARGNLQEAVVYYQLAYNHRPDSPAVLQAFADALYRERRCSQALELYRRLVRLDPTRREWSQRLEECRAEIQKARYRDEYLRVQAAPEVTRAQLAAILGLEFPEILESPSEGAPVILEDVRDHWAARFIVKVVENGFIPLYSRHRFEPNLVVNRGEMAEVLYRVLVHFGVDAMVHPSSGKRIADVSRVHRQYRAIRTAVSLGLLALDPAGRFHADRPVTGAEAVHAVQSLRNLVFARGRPGS